MILHLQTLFYFPDLQNRNLIVIALGRLFDWSIATPISKKVFLGPAILIKIFV